MKIALYSHSIPPSVDGVARRMTSLVQELTKQGHEILLFTLEKHPQLEAAGSPSTAPECRSTPCIPVRCVTLDSTFLRAYPSKRVATPTPGNIMLIANTLRREKPDVLHATVDGISFFFVLAAKILRVPVVGSVHTDIQELLVNLHVAPFVGAMVNVKEGLEARLLDACATTSPSFKEKLAGRGVLCDHILKTGVKVSQFRPAARNAEVRNRLTFGNPEGLLVVYVGRFGPEKRLDKLIRMCGSVNGVYLALIGDGTLGQTLSQRHGSWSNRSEASNGKRRTKGGVYCRPGFLEPEDLAPVYASADVHVSCSEFETLGNTVLEAHACGTTVLVPRAQGFVDTVHHGEDGFLFDGARLAEGAALLARLRDDRDLCDKMGEQGRIKVQTQSPEMVSRDVLAWYRRGRARAQASKKSSANSNRIRTSATAAAAWVKDLGDTLQSQVSVMMGIGASLLILGVVATWFAIEGMQGLCGSFVRYCHKSRNMLGDSSVFNKISNSYKALTNIAVERETAR